MNCFTWSKEDNYCIVPGDQYNEELKNWQGPIHNCQFCLQNLKDNKNTEETFSRYAVSAKFNGIPKEGNPTIITNSYKDQCREHIIMNGIWGVLYLPDPRNK